MPAATRTKRTKLPAILPPDEIRDNTKERRAWLAARLAEMQATPGVEARITGTGSYQQISAWRLTEVEGRERFRGHCQGCGGSQVAEPRSGGFLRAVAFHGYLRPGDGHAIGRCMGVGHLPLELSTDEATRWRNERREALPLAEARRDEAGRRLLDATRALDASGEDRQQAARAKPLGLPRGAAQDDIARHEAAMRDWRERFPLSAARAQASAEHQAAEAIVTRLAMEMGHFDALLSSGINGQPLTREIVA